MGMGIKPVTFYSSTKIHVGTCKILVCSYKRVRRVKSPRALPASCHSKPQSSQQMLVAELRAELKARGLKSSSRKAELEERLEEALIQEALVQEAMSDAEDELEEAMDIVGGTHSKNGAHKNGSHESSHCRRLATDTADLSLLPSRTPWTSLDDPTVASMTPVPGIHVGCGCFVIAAAAYLSTLAAVDAPGRYQRQHATSCRCWIPLYPRGRSHAGRDRRICRPASLVDDGDASRARSLLCLPLGHNGPRRGQAVVSDAAQCDYPSRV